MLDQDQRESIISLIKEAGRFQLKHFRCVSQKAVDMKAARETVSFVDVETEAILARGLKEIFPEAGFYGEELGKTGNQDLVWIVDPLDGTTNFLSGSDHFSISVSLVADSNPVFGVVYQPYIDETIVAIKGLGVFVCGKLQEIDFPALEASEALFVTGFPYRSDDLCDNFFKAAPRILKLGRGIRRSGSAALDLAHLGCGWYQGFWESDLQPYDVAAALLVMSESGIVATNHKGEPYDLFTDRVLVAAFPNVHPPLLEIVQESYADVLGE